MEIHVWIHTDLNKLGKGDHTDSDDSDDEQEETQANMQEPESPEHQEEQTEDAEEEQEMEDENTTDQEARMASGREAHERARGFDRADDDEFYYGGR